MRDSISAEPGAENRAGQTAILSTLAGALEEHGTDDDRAS
jgi:hypothetical protein